MKLPKLFKIILWRFFLYEKQTAEKSELPYVINYIKHDPNDDLTVFISFIKNQKGYLMLNAVEGCSDECVDDVKQALDAFLRPILSSLYGTGFHMMTYVHGVDEIPEEVEAAKRLAVTKMNLKERLQNFIQSHCCE